MRYDDDRDVALPAQLERHALDYKLESLHALDRYLELLHAREAEITALEWDRTVLWGGAYLGDVIRRNAKREYHWVDYDEYMPRHPELRPMIPTRNVATAAFLCTATDVMTLPLNKIARYIAEGPENNTHFYASVECRQE